MNRIFEVKVSDYINFMKHLNFEIPDRKERIDELSKEFKGKMKEIKQNFLKASEDIFQN